MVEIVSVYSREELAKAAVVVVRSPGGRSSIDGRDLGIEAVQLCISEEQSIELLDERGMNALGWYRVSTTEERW